MFHSGEKHSRTVDLLNELQHPYESTEANEATSSDNRLEFDQITPGDIDSFEFDVNCDFGRGYSLGTTNGSACFAADEQQYYTTFNSEDKWPI